jgi:hypothetical protein
VSSPNTTIAGRATRLSSSGGGAACPDLHATRSITAEVQLAASNELAMTACFRSPDTTLQVRQVTAMLRSLVLGRTPAKG